MSDLGERWNTWRSRRSPYTQELIFWVGLFLCVGVIFPLGDLYLWIRAKFGGSGE